MNQQNIELKKVLKQAIRKKLKEKLQNLQLQKYCQQNQWLSKALAHNKFGCICLQGNNLNKAEEHFHKAIYLTQGKVRFSNVFINLGNLYAQKRQYQNAIQYFLKAIQLSVLNQNIQEETIKQVQRYSKLNSNNAFVDAHTNLAVMYVNSNQFQLSYQYIKKAILLNPYDETAQINYGDILRQVGHKHQAIKNTWRLIKQNSGKNYQIPQPIRIVNQITTQSTELLAVCCVKWGTKYPAYYVNRLYSGVKRYYSGNFQFICFTDNSQGLKEQIIVKTLQKGWPGWWGKCTLFQQQFNKRMVYIDLDMVITGNLDDIFNYSGQFATLKTESFKCEKENKDGYNSSIMIWNGFRLKKVTEQLRKNFNIIKQYIVRFDYWLQMMIENGHFIQQYAKEQIGDYLNDCQQIVKQGIRIVCFARKPKPHQYPSQWIKQYWLQ